MTKKELSQLYYLNQEVEADKQRLKELKDEALSPAMPKLTGLPRNHAFASHTERYAAEIADLEQTIAHKITRCIQERNRLEKYIADIPDSLTRQIFTLRFIYGYSWVKVSMKIGGNVSDACARMICYRYIDKNK